MGVAMAHRVFRDKPSTIFCDEIVEAIRKTGEPEKCPELYTDRVPKDAKYEILRRIVIDGKKRPNGDYAPCPMCTPNRFLEGDLVYLPEMQATAVIGRCCAAHAAQANREYEARERIRREEDYLLEAFKLLGAKTAAIKSAQPVAGHALALYRKFRKNMPELQRILRGIKERGNAQLVLHEILHSKESGDESDYFGPRGFGGSGHLAADSRDINFGPLLGTTALIKDYNPVKELRDVEQNIGFLGVHDDEEEALNFIAAMSPEERTASVASLELAEKRFARFAARLRDCLAFFSEENISRLGRFGSHPLNHQPFKASYKPAGTTGMVQFMYNRNTCIISVLSDFARFDPAWEAAFR
jgi:hypothetical protein